MIWVTGDLHGGDTAYHVSSAKFNPKMGDIVFCCGDFGGVWYHDYHRNERHRKEENYFLEQRLRQRVTWLAVDGNHENFARLFGGEFPVVEIYGGKAYKIREHVYYLKRGEVFSIDGKTFLAFGGANSHDRFGGKIPSLDWLGGYDVIKPRTEGVDWWPEEMPSQTDFDNACRKLDGVGWTVDFVISHTCPVSQRQHFLKGSRVPDETENMLQALIDRGLQFKEWHFGHFHHNKREGDFNCHFNEVKNLSH